MSICPLSTASTRQLMSFTASSHCNCKGKPFCRVCDCFLLRFKQDNGLVRVNDILSWEKVSGQAGSDKSVLSFQRAYVPLLQVCATAFDQLADSHQPNIHSIFPPTLSSKASFRIL